MLHNIVQYFMPAAVIQLHAQLAQLGIRQPIVYLAYALTVLAERVGISGYEQHRQRLRHTCAPRLAALIGDIRQHPEQLAVRADRKCKIAERIRTVSSANLWIGAQP